MSWIEDATKVLAEGMTPEGKRMQIIAEPVEYSADLMPDGDVYVPTVYLDWSRHDLRLCHGLNWDDRYGVPDEGTLLHAVNELRSAFGHTNYSWEYVMERWLRIMNAKDARVREVQLDQSSWGVMISAYGQDWQDVTGVADDYRITDEDTEEFENWLKGDVSRVTAREATHDCNCEYCEVEWVEKADVFGMIVYADPWDIQDGINDKYAYVLDEVIAESEMIQREVAA